MSNVFVALSTLRAREFGSVINRARLVEVSAKTVDTIVDDPILDLVTRMNTRVSAESVPIGEVSDVEPDPTYNE